jgi:predicted AAA+ superfamily ATPase
MARIDLQVVIFPCKMTTMYTRSLSHLNHSFFLFGPRSTGKTTWLRDHYSTALWVNLLRNEEYLDYLKDKSLLRRLVEARSGGWVVIDEVQKLPELLNEVHDLISVHGERYKFAISGSSARKLKREGVNLLAGRAITRNFFPLISQELNYDFPIEDALKYGMLPDIHAKKDIRRDILKSYVTTYLREEIQQEALTRNLDSFSRFLIVSAITNGEILNIAGVSRDCGVSRTSCHNYFEILQDTLIGYLLPAWQPKAKIRETAKPKFYLFDCGVVNALAGDISLIQREDGVRGKLLETLILSELRAYIEYQSPDSKLYYWRDSQGKEIDFIIAGEGLHIGIEVKSSSTWRREYGKHLKDVQLDKRIAIYTGDSIQQEGDISIMPVMHFFRELHEGNILNCKTAT